MQPVNYICSFLITAYTVFTRVIHAQWVAEGGHSLTTTGKIRRPSIELMCSWIVRAWDMVDQRVIVTSFLKTGISSALDGSEDDALWQTEENVVKKVNQRRTIVLRKSAMMHDGPL